MTAVVAYVPDLMDRSRVQSALPAVRFVGAPSEMVDDEAEIAIVDLSRPGVLDVLPALGAKRTIGFASHVDTDLLRAARTAGCGEVLARSAFFTRLAELRE